MKKNQVMLTAAAGAAVLLIGILAAILIQRDLGMLRTECELYFLNEAGTSIEVEIREIKHKNPEMLPENVVVQLLKGPGKSKRKRLIDKNTKLLHLNTDGEGRVVVDFSREFLGDDSARNMQAVYSVVKSLCSVDGIKSVKVTVQGESIPVSGGGTVGYLAAEDINLPTDPHTSETTEIVLYFADKSKKRLCSFTKTIKVADQQPIEYYIVSGLIKGPNNKDYEPVLNKKTDLISVDTIDDICFVNLRENFIEKNTGDMERLAVYSIVNSLTELENINRVQILIEGKKVRKFGSMDISGIYTRNEDIIAVNP